MVYLTGAGTGRTGYLTEQAKQVIRQADILIYDNLINLSFLNQTRPECELIYVGKREGKHTLSQQEINDLLVQKGKAYACVVRLKGGDPYIFGRGGEEGQYLYDHGVPFETISGISSCFAVPAYAGIPVTHRDCASSFHVITGHKKSSGDEIDFAALARLSGTLVFLMGISQLQWIVENLIRYGMELKTPCAVIQNGTTPKQKEIFSDLANVVPEVQRCGITSPAVIVIGDVCRYHAALRSNDSRPLSHKTIALTGTPYFTDSIRPLIQEQGGDCLDLGLIQINPISFQAFAEIDFNLYTWIVFSSANGVKTFFSYWRKLRYDIRRLSHIKIAAIGEKTANSLYEDTGIIAECVPEFFYNKNLGEVLVSKLTDSDRVLLARAKESSQILTDILAQNHVSYTDFPLYETITDYRKKDALRLMDTDYIVFASASAVKAYHQLRDLSKPIPKIISIGNVTTHTLTQLGYTVYRTAAEATAEGIIAEMKG